MAHEEVSFCADDELGYGRSRTRIFAGSGLELDDAYRLAHLPLVAPDHPDVILKDVERGYARGRHAPIHSLVLPVPNAALQRSDAYTQLGVELRDAPFAAKIAWNIVERRAAKLHATVCGSLATGGEPPVLEPPQRQALAGLGPIRCEIRGLFSGNINLGRLYLRLYPERRDGANMLRRVQQALGRPETDLYLIGIWNLTDHLNAAEASALDGLIERWWDRPILRFQVDRLWLLSATDDLVLDSEVTADVRLARRPGP